MAKCRTRKIGTNSLCWSALCTQTLTENASERVPFQTHPCLPAACLFKSKALQKWSLLPLHHPALPSPHPPSLCRVSLGRHRASAVADTACPSFNWETIPHAAAECSFSALRLTQWNPSSTNADRSLQEACSGACHRLGPWGSAGAVSHAVYAGLAGGSGNTG